MPEADVRTHPAQIPAETPTVRAPLRPILVTGAPRSGSTWVGNILSLDRGSGYIHEPFNKDCPDGYCQARFAHAFTYVTAANEGPYYTALRDTLAWRYSLGAERKTLRTPRQLARMARDFGYFETKRRAGARVILKDPLALFSADWLAQRFGTEVVVVIRHPAAFVASLRIAGWHRVRFAMFRDQPQLMQDRLAPFADEVAAAAARMPDAIDAGVLLWKLLHHHIQRLQQEHPDWIFVRHEDLSRDPTEGFRTLFDRLGLDFSDEVRRKLMQSSDTAALISKLSLFGTRRRTVRNSHDALAAFRKRLSSEEITRIRAGAGPLGAHFYPKADW